MPLERRALLSIGAATLAGAAAREGAAATAAWQARDVAWDKMGDARRRVFRQRKGEAYVVKVPPGRRWQPAGLSDTFIVVGAAQIPGRTLGRGTYLRSAEPLATDAGFTALVVSDAAGPPAIVDTWDMAWDHADGWEPFAADAAALADQPGTPRGPARPSFVVKIVSDSVRLCGVLPQSVDDSAPALAPASNLDCFVLQGADQADPAMAPFAAPALANPSSDWTVIKRPDGIRQWAHRARPLYTHHKESEIRNANPVGVFAPVLVEELPAMPDWVTVQIADTGAVVADARGMSLYIVRNMDQVIREQTCLDACMKANWRTVPADPAARPVGNWSIVPDQDGKPIWSYMGAILFTHTRDRKPGDTMGYGVGVGQGIGGGWRPIPVANLLPAGR